MSVTVPIFFFICHSEQIDAGVRVAQIRCTAVCEGGTPYTQSTISELTSSQTPTVSYRAILRS
jgi:hypothetical protein